ncbi:hypothetical protein AS189_14455 [Arthrobacter alpinus]|uniref:Uncharacterized protein n=1 Tax=Arthrobacter alpinus TaxID=656366 RepID=A0A0S2M1V9_9MICC|nr:hypothetical protein [Arthrobacter alpinus]ALO67472.1 hypothetical protein AS189_14455 [Arthrobacter alpinus]
MSTPSDSGTFDSEPSDSGTAGTSAGSEQPSGLGLPERVTGLRALLAHRRFTPFHRILILAVLANTAVAILLLLSVPDSAGAMAAAITAATINLAVATLARQQYAVNALFAAVLSVPHNWPLRRRATAAQVHQVPGGVHVGCAISATAWFGAYAALAVTGSLPTAVGARDTGLRIVAATILLDLLAMSLWARPSARERHHDAFEATHRYGGWLALALFIALTIMAAAEGLSPVLGAVFSSPNAWIVAALVVMAAIPWLQLRRIKVHIDCPSDHVAVVTMAAGRVLSGSAARLARHPFGQWHSFATMTVPGQDGCRFAISRTGGWTARFIEEPPTHIWTRGVPTAGMVSVSRAFHKVVWLATGSGIAPCLPQLLEGATPCTLVWVTRDPVRTYGRSLAGEIRAAIPDATFWNTDLRGKPDLAVLAYGAYRQTGAEAVMVVSNKSTTLAVVAELRSRGVPAFGPIWDS